MNLTLVRQLAWRYLRGKRTANAVPVLSRISMVAIGVGAAAMIMLFSVFNGFEYIVRDLYKAFYPEIKITAARGKFFSIDDATYNNLLSTTGIGSISRVIEDNVMVSSNAGEKRVATLKGVDDAYFKVNDIEKYVTDGRSNIETEPVRTAIAGIQLLGQLGLDVNNVFSYMEIYYPNPKATPAMIAQSPQTAFRSLRLRPDGAFTVQEEFDNRFVLADIGLVQELLNEKGKYSSLELSLQEGADEEQVRSEIRHLLGEKYLVQTRFEQNKALYMVMRSEKWAVYGILVLVLMIAAFNMIGALALLVLEKQKDIAMLKAMGAGNRQVSSIFVAEGLLWSLIGGSGGLLLGMLLCLGQQQFGWIKLGGAFIIDAYPVRLQATDFLVVLGTIVLIGLLAAWFPATRATKTEGISLRSD